MLKQIWSKNRLNKKSRKSCEVPKRTYDNKIKKNLM